MRPTSFAESIANGAFDDQQILRKPRFVPEESNRVFTVTASDISVLIFIPPIRQRMRTMAPGASLRCVPTRGHTVVTTSKLWPENSAYDKVARHRELVTDEGSRSAARDCKKL